MSNICSRCGQVIQFGLVPFESMRDGHCHFCVREFKELTEKIDANREKSMKELERKWGLSGAFK